MAATVFPEFGANHFLQLRHGQLRGTTPQQVEGAFAALATDPHRQKLVLYFHGGLDDETAGMAIAQSLYPVFRAAEAYPYFFVWRSGWKEVIEGRLLAIMAEFVFNRIVEWVAEFAYAKVMEPGTARGGDLELPVREQLRELLKGERPFADVKPEDHLPAGAVLTDGQRAQFERALRSDKELTDAAAGIARWLNEQGQLPLNEGERGDLVKVAPRPTLLSPDVLDDIRAEASAQGEARGGVIWRLIKGGAKVLYHVIARYVSGRHHDFYPTIIEETLREFYFAEVGQIIWRYMKDDTAAAFGTDPRTFGGTAVLQALRRQWGPNVKPTIYLVGHSTGAVYICHFLYHAAQWLPGAHFEVVWAAPACTYELFYQYLPYFHKRVQHMRVFGMQDDLERQDPLLGSGLGRFAYPYSLLYFVSGVVEKERDTPLVGMQRYHGGAAPYDDPVLLECGAYLKRMQSGTIWSRVTGATPGLSSQAIRHGGFCDEPITRASLQAIVSGGF